MDSVLISRENTLLMALDPYRIVLDVNEGHSQSAPDCHDVPPMLDLTECLFLNPRPFPYFALSFLHEANF